MKSPYELFSRAEGTADCAVTGAMPAAFLSRCAAEGVTLRAVAAVDETALRCTVALRDLDRARAAALRSQCEMTVLKTRGGKAAGRRLKRRWVPAVCLLACFCLLAWSKLFIWEIDVTGNETVSAGRVRSALADCGVGLGTFWPGLTSDNLRSRLLARMPELAWATVNIHGSRAEVIVRERIPKPVIFDSDEPVDLVAKRLGFITEVRALNGKAAVQPGSAVLPGDVLISGSVESAFSGTRETHAAGTVTAETYYELSAAAPVTETVRADSGRQRSRWALLLGKKRVNFYGNSSFCPADCDKIISIWECKSEGLFALPLALVRETAAKRVTAGQPRDRRALRQSLEQQLHERLLAEVDGGEIESEEYTCAISDGRMTVCLRARCSENIAEERKK